MRKNIGPALGVYPTPVVLVGTYDENGRPNIATLAWVGVCCSEPPSVQISLRKSRHTHKAILERRAFSVNVPSAQYVAETDYCGIASGKNADKFETAALTPIRGELLEVPLVAEFPISMECRLTHTLELGSHDLFVGEILACWADETAIREGNRLDASAIRPLAYMPEFGSQYHELGRALGAGFNAGKTLMKK